MEENAVETSVVEQDVPRETDFEQEALTMGWAPQERYKGDPSKWVDAETFVKRGKEILPIVQARLEKEREHTARLSREIQEIRETQKGFLELQRKTLEAKFQEQLDALKAARKHAIEVGDGDALNAADDQIHELRTAQAKTATPQRQQPQIDPEFEQWIAEPENRWYEEDQDAREFADGLAIIAAGKHGKRGRALYDHVSRQMADKYGPWQNKRQLDKVDGGGNTGRPAKGSSGAKTYERMPKEYQQACEDAMRYGMVKSRDDFVKQYYASVGE